MLQVIFGNDGFIKVSAALVAVCTAVKFFLPPHPTVAGTICDAVISAGVVIGVGSTASRQQKP